MSKSTILPLPFKNFYFLPILTIAIFLDLLSFTTTSSSSSQFSCTNLTSSCTCQQSSDPISTYEVDCMNIVPQNNPYLTMIYIPERNLKLTCYGATKTSILSIGGLTYEEDPEYEEDITTNPLSLLSNIAIYPAEELVMTQCNFTEILATFEEIMLKTKPKKLNFRYLTFPNGDLPIDEIETTTFEGISNITNVTLEHNNFIHVPYDFLSKMLNLEEIIMNFNELQSLHGPFNNNLKIMLFGSNNINYIHPTTFQDLKQLKVLHLWGNNINQLAEGLFDDLQQLESLELMRNSLSEIPSEAFHQLTHLKTINLAMNQFSELPEDLFVNNKLLISIRLEGNKLSQLPIGIFKNCLELTNLTLQSNKLTYLDDTTFQGLNKLVGLNLERNQLSEIPSKLFSPLEKLKSLKLGFNNIERVSASAFDKLGELIELDLGYNKIKYLSLTTFVNQLNLEKLNLAKNEMTIENPGDPTFVNYLQSLRELDLSYNLFEDIPMDFLNTKPHMEKLIMINNILTSFDFETIQGAISNVEIDLSSNLIHSIENMESIMLRDRIDPASLHFRKKLLIHDNPIACNSSNYDLYRYFTGDLDKDFQTAYDIRPENIMCSSPSELVGKPLTMKNPCRLSYTISSCPGNCDCYHTPLDNTATIDCRARNLTSVPKLFAPRDLQFELARYYCHLENELTPNIKVILKDNRLRYLEPKSFENFSVSVLDTSFNNISSLTWIPQGLKLLQLDHNDLSRINKTLLETVNNVTLDNNPWICDCETVPFWIYLTDNIIANKIDIRCVDNHKSIRLLTREHLCPSYSKLIITLVVVIAILVIVPAIVLTFYYKYKQEIKVWLFAHNMCLWFVQEEDLDKDKIYDAFISFSQKDEDFIVDELMPKLENIPNPYKLCVHMRNFIPGEYIAKQVADSVHNSRRTIVVLSPSFLDSVWGKMEFRAAHTTAISEGIARVIIIIYGDLDLNDERIDGELRVYLKTNTYIKWGDPWFWDKLKYALPHKKGTQSTYTNKKFDNITINIDKMDPKFDQNVNVNIGNGNNASIDTLLLKNKKNELFGHDTPPAEKGIV